MNKIKRVLNNSSRILFIFCQQSTSFFSNTSSPKCEREKGWWDRGRKNSHSQTTRVFSCVPQFPLVICVIWKNCHWLHLFCWEKLTAYSLFAQPIAAQDRCDVLPVYLQWDLKKSLWTVYNNNSRGWKKTTIYHYYYYTTTHHLQTKHPPMCCTMYWLCLPHRHLIELIGHNGNSGKVWKKG